MASTLAQLRAALRQEIGDMERITGTATGGSLTTIIDTTKLDQVDNHWRSLKVFIRDTTDDLAPNGDQRRIASSSQSATSLTVELPFSAAVEAGDEYAIAVFSDVQLNAAINNALMLEMSKWLPFKTSETLNVSANLHRFAPVSANSIRWIDKVEFIDSSLNVQIDYAGMWSWNEFLRMVEWSFFWSESRTLNMLIARDHAALSLDADTVTVLPREEPMLVKLASADLLLAMTEQQIRTDFGNISPKSWKRGDVSESYDSIQDHFGNVRKAIVEEMKALASGPAIGFYPRRGAPYSAEDMNVDIHADPDGRSMPQVFWTLR